MYLVGLPLVTTCLDPVRLTLRKVVDKRLPSGLEQGAQGLENFCVFFHLESLGGRVKSSASQRKSLKMFVFKSFFKGLNQLAFVPLKGILVPSWMWNIQNPSWLRTSRLHTATPQPGSHCQEPWRPQKRKDLPKASDIYRGAPDCSGNAGPISVVLISQTQKDSRDQTEPELSTLHVIPLTNNCH